MKTIALLAVLVVGFTTDAYAQSMSTPSDATPVPAQSAIPNGSPLNGLSSQPQPELMHHKDYVDCMGGVTPQQNPQRDAYCQCVHAKLVDAHLDNYDFTTGANGQSDSKSANALMQAQQIIGTCMKQVGKIQ